MVLGFFVSKNSNSFLNHLLKVQKLELNNFNHIEFNHTLMTLFPQSTCLKIRCLDGCLSRSQSWSQFCVWSSHNKT